MKKGKRNKYELYNIKAINGRNNFNELKGLQGENITINNEFDLLKYFYEYGEEKLSSVITKKIVSARKEKEIEEQKQIEEENTPNATLVSEE